MTNPPTDERREAFEAWLTKRAWFTIAKMRLEKAVRGGYKDYRVNDRWNAWNAAIDSQSEVVKVSELRDLCKTWKDISNSTHGPASYAEGLVDAYDDLTALISKAEKV